MEVNDEVVERQKLVTNDLEIEDESNSQVASASQSAPKSAPIPAAPVVISKIKSISSGETTRSQNSASCSVEQPTSDKGQSTARVTYVNERRKLQDDAKFDFKSRPRKLLKEVPDVKHMEKLLLGLLDDFHSGKLKAFGSCCTMEQMTKIRQQQESLAKLHFELAAAQEEHSLTAVGGANKNSNVNAACSKAQENMIQLVQRLEELSISIEQLQSTRIGL